MSSLFASLGIARQALQAQQYGLDVTQNNIANVNTPGYSRQRVNLAPGDAQFTTTYSAGSGVRLGSIESYRSGFLDHRVNDETQLQGEFDASSTTLQQVESIFNEGMGSGLQTSLSAFFNSFQALSATPEDISLRQQVLARAEDLSAQFKQCYERLQAIQTQQNGIVSDTVSEINTITSGIAQLNVAIASAKGANTDETTLRDRRQELLDRLAGLVDINYFETDTGSVTVMSRQGTLLAVGDDANEWSTGYSGDGATLGVFADGADITSTIRSGKLGGVLKTRDENVVGYLSDLDEMAAGIMDRVNEQHADGLDLNGTAGGDFFSYTTTAGSLSGAARSMQVVISDPRLIAAGEAGSGVGSNANALKLAGIKSEAIMPGGANLDQYYSNFIFRVGLDTKTAVDSLDTQNNLLTQLENQRDAVSGVSLDEEAINILRYQKAYQANANFLNVLNQLTEDLLSIMGG
jgi:flagellar hook-associated protein 1